jgi:hypothetical protein
VSDLGKSNITIASNIHDSHNFMKNVVGSDELVQLKNKLGADGFTKEQENL